MKTNHGSFPIACLLAALLVVVALGPACEDSTQFAHSDWELQVFANPQTLTLAAGEEGQSTILAVVSNSTGVPQENVGVRFTTTAGTLASGSALLSTNSNGEVRDTLTTADTATVTATSATLTSTVTVTVVPAAAARVR